jgi:hypothetical protein
MVRGMEGIFCLGLFLTSGKFAYPKYLREFGFFKLS